MRRSASSSSTATASYENINAGVPRLCIPSLAVQDGPQGLAYGDTNVTQLPSPLGIAATFNTATARAYGVVEGSEASGQGIDAIQGPTLNIDRVPESGRSYEGYGEDPMLVSAMGVADIEGIQSTGTMAMAKHFAVYSQETDRGVLDDQVSERALHELYLPPFKAAVTQAHVGSVMCAYPRAQRHLPVPAAPAPRTAQHVGVHRLHPFRPRVGARPGVRHRVRHRPHQTGERRPAGRTGAAGPAPSVGGGHRRHPPAHRHVHPPSGGPVRARHAGHTGRLARPRPLRPHRRRAVRCPSQGPRLRPPPVPRPRPIGGGHRCRRLGWRRTPPAAAARGSPPRSPPPRWTAIRQRAGTHIAVTYTNGASTTRSLPAVPTSLLRPASGSGHGLTVTITRTDATANASAAAKALDAASRSSWSSRRWTSPSDPIRPPPCSCPACHRVLRPTRPPYDRWACPAAAAEEFSPPGPMWCCRPVGATCT